MYVTIPKKTLQLKFHANFKPQNDNVVRISDYYTTEKNIGLYD